MHRKKAQAKGGISVDFIPFFFRSNTHTHTSSALSPEPNKSVRQIERAGRPDSGVKHMPLRNSADRQRDHTNSACLGGNQRPTYLIYGTEYECNVLYMPTVKHRPHYRMSVVLVVDLPAVVELNKSQCTENMPGVRVSQHRYTTF